MTITPEIIGTVPQWISGASLVVILGLVLRYRVALLKLSMDDGANISDHYTKEVTSLREALAKQDEASRNLELHLRDLLVESDRRHEECEVARRELRKEIDKMHNEISGLQRQIVRYSADRVLYLGEKPPSHSRKSAARVKKIVGEGDDRATQNKSK